MKIGAFTLDHSRNRLSLGDAVFRLEPLVMDVLCLLADNPGEVVDREDIIDHVWMVRAGGDESLTRAIGILRRIFAHDREAGPYLETVWKRGYALVAPVRGQPSSGSRLVAMHGGSASVQQKAISGYSVAVLPFANASPAPEDAFLADGITRDLTMLLGRVPRLKVAAYSSALLCREGHEWLGEIAHSLGVRYVISGSLQRTGSRFHVRAALMDAARDEQVWGKRLDAPLEEFFEVQDQLVLDISTSLASALQISYAAQVSGRRPFQLSAYELVQRAEALRLRYNQDTAFEIVGLLDQALAIDPEDATVHAALAVQHTQNVVSSFVQDYAGSFALAKRHLERALSLAPQDPEALAAAGIAATMMGNARGAVRHLEKALELDPNNAHTLAVLGWQHCWVHGTREGIDMIRKAEARAPHHPRFPVWAHYRGHCEIRLGNIAAAVDAYREGEERNPGYSLNLATLVAALGLLERWDEARATVNLLHEANPRYRPYHLEALARRMIFWFGETPSRDAFLAAFAQALETPAPHRITDAR